MCDDTHPDPSCDPSALEPRLLRGYREEAPRPARRLRLRIAGGNPRRNVWGVGLVAGSLALAACSGGATGDSSASQAPAGKPVSVKNCGIELRLDHPVKRAVTLEQGATETLLALGAKDLMVGTSHRKEKLRPDLQKAFDSVPELSPDPATAEQIRSVDPDFIYSPFIINYTRDKSGDRQEWVAAGVQPFVSNVDCRDEPENKGKDGFALIAEDFRQLGVMFDKQDTANSLVKDLDDAIAQAREVADKGGKHHVSIAFLYSMYEGAPYIAGSKSIAQDMADFNGARNVFDDVHEDWPTVSWEAFAGKDPDYIVLADLSGRGAPGDTPAEKIKELETNPATRHMRAVREKKYIEVPGVGLTQSVRTVEPLRIITERLVADSSKG